MNEARQKRIEALQRAARKIRSQRHKLTAIEEAWKKETGHRFNYWDHAWTEVIRRYRKTFVNVAFDKGPHIDG